MKAISTTKIITVCVVVIIGILCGVLYGLDNGTWAIRQAKSTPIGESLVGAIVSFCCMVGVAANYLATKDRYFSLGYFWLGHLAFYTFLVFAIIKVRRKNASTQKK